MSWVVRQCLRCHGIVYLHGTAKDWEDWECDCGCKGYVDIPESAWDAEAVAVIAGNDLESANYHELVMVPEALLMILREKQYNISEDSINKIMRSFVEKLKRGL